MRGSAPSAISRPSSRRSTSGSEKKRGYQTSKPRWRSCRGAPGRLPGRSRRSSVWPGNQGVGATTASVDEAASGGAHGRRGARLGQHLGQRGGQRLRVAGREQPAGLAVPDQLAVAAHVAGHQQPPLRHGLQRLERRHQVGQAHRVARVRQHVHQVVVALHLIVRHAAREHHALGHAQALRPGPQRFVLRAAAHQQQAHLRAHARQRRQRVEQQVQALVGVERPDEAHDLCTFQSQPAFQVGIGCAAQREGVDVHRVRDHRDAAGGDAALDDVAPQPLADREHVVGLAQCARLHRARQPVAQAALGGGAVVDRGVLPEGAHLVDHRDAQAPGHAQRGQRVQHRRVGVDQVGAHGCRHRLDARGKLSHQRHLVEPRHTAPAGCGRRAMEVPAVHRLLQRRAAGSVLGAGQVEGLPPERALLAQQRQRAERVPAVQRDRVVEDVEDAHSAPPGRSEGAERPLGGPRTK